jgi:hypothetical protein
LAHCLLPDTQANSSQKSKSQIFPLKIIDNQLFIIFANRKVHLNLNINKKWMS